MLLLLIPGPKAPGNDVDVFLEPLVEDLKSLWDVGVETYDFYSREKFNIKAALLWTISDFSEYANLSGWSTMGRLDYPSCHKEACHKHLYRGSKEFFYGQCRFLDLDHKWRNDNKSFFGGKETRPAPATLTGDEILETLSQFDNVKLGKIEARKQK